MTEPACSYVTSGGERFEFGPALGRVLSSADALGWELTRSNGLYSAEERTMDATLAYGSRDSLAECERMAALAELDCLAGTPGTLSVGEWSIHCFLEKGEAVCSERGWRGWQVTLRAPDPFWTRATTTQFLPTSASGLGGGLDLPCDLPCDLWSGRRPRLESPAAGPCDFRLVVFGPAVDPAVTIGGTVHGVNVTVPEGGRLVVDSTLKRSMAHDSVVLVDRWGETEDVFDRRVRGAEGSGSYLFERIGPGVVEVSWADDFGFDLTLYERRSRLPWT